MIIAIILTTALAMVFIFLFIVPELGKEKEVTCKDLQPGEWQPQQGECQSQEMQQKCDEFCLKHPSCCS